ncbi:MAG: lamin tail domain-containing protein [Patescibacteria group bacterium]
MKIASLFLSIIIFIGFAHFTNAVSLRDVAINEVAWSGTKSSSGDEWIELKNNTGNAIDLTGWGIYEQGGDVLIVVLEGIIQPAFFYLTERTDDNTVSDIAASQTPKSFSGSGLSNSGEYLVLKDASGVTIDSVNAAGGWFFGATSPDYFSMERIDSLASGDDVVNWKSNNGVTRNGKDAEGNPINGTPLAENSKGGSGISDQGGDSESASPSGGESSSSGSSSISLAVNNSPQANAGDDIFTFLGETIQFDASKSSDSDSDKLTFEWNLGNGEIIKEEKFGYVHQFPGKYIITLTVSDGFSKASDEARAEIISGGIKISEFLPDPDGKDEEGEWIEIFNSSDYLADLGGWQLDDMADGGSKPWIFPEKTFISPKSYLVISRDISGIALNNDKDTARLIYPNGIVADEIVYEKSKEGDSGVLMGGSFFWSKFPTPGATNILEAEVTKSLGAKPMNSYFVENFSEAYQNVIYNNISGENKDKKNLVIIGSGKTNSGVLEELSNLPSPGLSEFVESGTRQVGQNKFVPSKNMLQAAVGNNLPVKKLFLFIFLAIFAGGAVYLFFYIKRKKRASLGNFAPLVGALKQNNAQDSVKQSWDIFIDD